MMKNIQPYFDEFLFEIRLFIMVVVQHSSPKHRKNTQDKRDILTFLPKYLRLSQSCAFKVKCEKYYSYFFLKFINNSSSIKKEYLEWPAKKFKSGKSWAFNRLDAPAFIKIFTLNKVSIRCKVHFVALESKIQQNLIQCQEKLTLLELRNHLGVIFTLQQQQQHPQQQQQLNSEASQLKTVFRQKLSKASKYLQLF